MDTNTLIDSLVTTYKDLNIRFRTAGDSEVAHRIVKRMRDDEIGFSQALKDHLTGIGTADGKRNEVVDGGEAGLGQIISQFGTARATTLNLLKGIENQSVWTKPTDDGKNLMEHVQNLVQSDRVQLQRLGEELGR